MRQQCFLWFVMVSVLMPRVHLHVANLPSQEEAEVGRACDGEAPFHEDDDRSSCPGCEPQAIGLLEKLEPFAAADQSIEVSPLVILDSSCGKIPLIQNRPYPDSPPLYLAHCAFLN